MKNVCDLRRDKCIQSEHTLIVSFLEQVCFGQPNDLWADFISKSSKKRSILSHRKSTTFTSWAQDAVQSWTRYSLLWCSKTTLLSPNTFSQISYHPQHVCTTAPITVTTGRESLYVLLSSLLLLLLFCCWGMDQPLQCVLLNDIIFIWKQSKDEFIKPCRFDWEAGTTGERLRTHLVWTSPHGDVMKVCVCVHTYHWRKPCVMFSLMRQRHW